MVLDKRQEHKQDKTLVYTVDGNGDNESPEVVVLDEHELLGVAAWADF